MDTAHSEPTPTEVLKELTRIKQSKRFRKAATSARFLELLVNTALDSASLTEYEIGIAVFGRLPGWVPLLDSIVRTGRHNLQKYLREYYVTEGTEDLIVIEVTEGPTYKAIYSYNPKGIAEVLYREGLSALDSVFVFGAHVERPHSLFTEALKHEPSHAPALAGRAEAEIMRRFFWKEQNYSYSGPTAESDALKAVELAPGFWRAHAALGAVRSCQLKWEKAGDSYRTAMSLSASSTQRYLWYPMFLAGVHREKEALELVEAWVRTAPDDLVAETLLGLFLYMTRRFEEAQRVLHHILTTRGVPLFPGFLFDCVRVALGLSTHSLISACRKAFCVEGFHIVALHASGRIEEAAILASGLQYRPRSQYFPMFQQALVRAIYGDMREAVHWIGTSLHDENPWSMFIRLFPILDPFRKNEEFNEIARDLVQNLYYAYL